MRTCTWKIVYKLEGVTVEPEDLSDATREYVADQIKECYTKGNIEEPGEGVDW